MASTINAKNTTSGVVITPDSSGNLSFQTADTTAMTIDTNQNVGIGTNSPNTKVDSSQSTGFNYSATRTSSSGYNGLSFYENTTNTSYIVEFGSGAGGGQRLQMWTNTAFPIAFGTNNTERMRIDSSGNLLVGKTTTAETTAGACFSTAANNIGLSSGNYFIVNYVPGGASTMIDFRTGGVSKGSISQNGSVMTYGGTSDYRLKENITPMTGGLEKVAALKPCTYVWKETGQVGQGFIAHELQEVVPDAVVGEKDAVNEDGSIKPQFIDTSHVVATLTSAIQELKAIVDTQAEQIKALEAK